MLHMQSHSICPSHLPALFIQHHIPITVLGHVPIHPSSPPILQHTPTVPTAPPHHANYWGSMSHTAVLAWSKHQQRKISMWICMHGHPVIVWITGTKQVLLCLQCFNQGREVFKTVSNKLHTPVKSFHPLHSLGTACLEVLKTNVVCSKNLCQCQWLWRRNNIYVVAKEEGCEE